MTLTKIKLKPGINKEITATLNEGGWSDCNLMRFRQLLPEKWGGWQNAASAGQSFVGCCRALFSWSQLNGQKNAAPGTDLKLFLFQGGSYYDITPDDATGTLTNPFSTTSGSPTVNVAHTAHGRSVGDYVIFGPGFAVVGGLDMNGPWRVTTVVDANNYKITHTSNAGSTAGPLGGTHNFEYLLPVGTCDAAGGVGWGAGPWGGDTWGTPRSIAVNLLLPRFWSLDAWGEDLVASPRDGKIYRWDASAGTGTRAALISVNAPTLSKTILVGLPERHLIAFGCDTAGIQDPMLIRWCDTEDFTIWAATATNAAGSFRLQGGSEILQVLAGTREILIFTDTSLHSMRFSGLPYVYEFDQLGSGCGLIGPKAAGFYNGAAYWMDQNGFHTYRGGSPQKLRCDVWKEVFMDINFAQRSKVTCAMNEAFNEATWFYPSSGSIENDRYVSYNWLDDIWTVGGLQRTAWDRGDIFGFPIAANTTPVMYYHEFGNDDDGSPMSWFIKSGDFDIADGDEFMFANSFIPDADASGIYKITVEYRGYPNDDPVTVGPTAVDETTELVNMPGRGRQANIMFSGNDSGQRWRMGGLRVDISRDGKAP